MWSPFLWTGRWMKWLYRMGQFRGVIPAQHASRARLGEDGEAIAARYLGRQGMHVIVKRYRNRFGELDLVAIDRRTIVFVEVKTWRQSPDSGSDQNPAEAVDSEKQQRLARAALSFLKQYQLLECSARFDVVSISWADRSDRPQIRHFVHAFEPVGFGQFFR